VAFFRLLALLALWWFSSWAHPQTVYFKQFLPGPSPVLGCPA